MRLAPRSIMQLVGRLHFYLSFIVDNRHCGHRRRHLQAQTALNYHHLRRRHLWAQTALNYHHLRRRHFTGTNRP